VGHDTGLVIHANLRRGTATKEWGELGDRRGEKKNDDDTVVCSAANAQTSWGSSRRTLDYSGTKGGSLVVVYCNHSPSSVKSGGTRRYARISAHTKGTRAMVRNVRSLLQRSCVVGQGRGRRAVSETAPYRGLRWLG
jgi:hypothetical protein